MAGLVARIFTPKQVLAILRVLKALSLCFIVLTIIADAMYILFVEFISTPEVREMAGGVRDIIIRVYGLILAVIALSIELDFAKVVKKFSGLKPFIARSFLYFLIAVVTGSHPVYDKEAYAQEVESGEYYGNDGNDDQYGNNWAGDDAAAYDEDYQAQSSSSSWLVEQVNEIPESAVGFQRFTSLVLAICALAYFICGLLCFDRFTARAFLSVSDPRVTTAIPTKVSDYRRDLDDEEQDYHRHDEPSDEEDGQ